MEKLIKKLPKDVQGLIRLISKTAAENNVAVYLVGGFVRDLLLGARNLDLDIVAQGDGIGFAEILAGKLRARLISHKRFGTATINLNPQQKIDITTARKEYYLHPAHLPVVSRSTIKEDLFRRDFTINAMAMSINHHDSGRLIDFFGGQKDLGAKKIRILHDLSFIDDPTRILRAVRFEQRYNFKIEPNTLGFLKNAVRIKMLEKTQPHRIRDELVLALKENQPLKEIRRLKALTGFNFISPKLSFSQKTISILLSCQREIEWFNRAYPSRRLLDSWLVYFMGLVDNLTFAETKVVCRKFAFRKGEQKRILDLKSFEKKLFSGLKKAKIKPSGIFKLLQPSSYEVILLLKAKYKALNIQRNIRDFFEIYNGIRISVCGQDLNSLGFKPGPHYQKIFSRVLHAKLDGCVRTKDEELELIKTLKRS